LKRDAIAVCTLAACLAACSTPVKMSPGHLASLGVTEGTEYRSAEQKLAGEGYECHATGAKKENVDCAKTTGFLITCILRVRFTLDDRNRISDPLVPEPACIGTP
jgi:hypothetical protein